MSDIRIQSFKNEVRKTIDRLHGEFAKLQTGRANAALIEDVSVDSYGSRQPLKALATVTVQDARCIVVQPWDKGILRDIEVSLQNADFGAQPVNDGTLIRLNLPPMTEERREQLKKLVHKLAEEARISIRQHRLTVNDDIKQNEKDEDVKFTLLDDLQKAVDEANKQVEESMKNKEQEVMTV